MIASVQYNDLRGTAAADVSDYLNNSLQSYLEKTFDHYDGERFFCNGCKIWISGDSIEVEKPCVRDPRSPSAVDPRKQV